MDAQHIGRPIFLPQAHTVIAFFRKVWYNDRNPLPKAFRWVKF